MFVVKTARCGGDDGWNGSVGGGAYAYPPEKKR